MKKTTKETRTWRPVGVPNQHRKVSPEETARKVFARRGIPSRAWVRQSLKPFLVEVSA